MDEIKTRRFRALRTRTARKIDSGVVYELSSDDDTSVSDKIKPGIELGEVISLDDDPEPTSSKKIAITIDTPTKRVIKSTKITIQIEDSEGSNGCQIDSEVQIGSDITSNSSCQRGFHVKNSNGCQRVPDVNNTNGCPKGLDVKNSNGCQREFDIKNMGACESGPDVKNSNCHQRESNVNNIDDGQGVPDACRRKSHITDSCQKISEITPINVCKRGFGYTEQQRKKTTDEPTEKIRRVNLISQPKVSDEMSSIIGKTKKNETKDERKSEIFGKEFKSENTIVPCYVEFMDTCKKINNSKDMTHILEKKVKHYYRRAEESYVRSHEFERMIVKCIENLNSDPLNIWVHIKAVVDMLRDRKKSRNVIPESSLAEDPRTVKKIEDLEKTLQTLQELVERLEGAEVNFDDEDESTYLKADKYKARLVSVHARLCKLRGARASSYSRVRLERRAGRAGGPAAVLEEWVNRPVATGQPPRFPDFHDVVGCVREACRSDSLHWSDAQVMKEARELFTRCGRALQKMRQRREWRLAESRLQCVDGEINKDPAETSAELQARLMCNRTIARQREQQVLDEFENRQIFGKTEYKDDSDSDIEKSSKTVQESGTVSDDNETPLIENPKESSKVTDSPETAVATNAPTQASQNSDSKSNDSNGGMTQDELDDRKQLMTEKDRCEVQDVPSLLILRDKEIVKGDTECEVISSDEEGSDESESSDESVVVLSDGEEESRCAVSDSSVGSGEDELHLLRRVEMRRRGGVRYSTSVSHVRNSTSDDSDYSACVLIDSHDEDSRDSNSSTHPNKEAT